MTAPEHDPAVDGWEACGLFGGPLRNFDRSGNVVVIPADQLARLMADDEPDPAPGLRAMVLARRAKSRPDMPDRWEGDDS